ncbi:MAG TPA: iron ABC transporter permease [Bauldia sp.]|nr:iron ABC transporter permease [Bauldia sp.]
MTADAAPSAVHRRPATGAVPWLTLTAALVAALGLLPIAFVAGVAIDVGWATVEALVFRPRVGMLLVNTMLLVVLAVPICTAIGLALAWLTERTRLPGRRAWVLLTVAPLAVPAFVQSYAWVSLVPSIHGLFGGVLVSVLAYFPFLYLPIAAALRRLDPGLEDAAASLGVTPLRRFFRVVLPQLRLAILGGALLVELHLLAEYGLFAMIRFDTFTTAIFEQFQSTFNGPAANMLAGVLAVCCLAFLAFDAAARGHMRFARLGQGTARAPQLQELPPGAAALCLVLPLAMALLSLGVPVWTLGQWLLFGGTAVWKDPALGAALLQTIGYAALGAAVTTAAAIPMAWLSVRAGSRTVRALEACNYVSSALPGIVIALALVSITVRVALPLYQTVFTVMVAYGLMFLPRALVGLRASIAQVPPDLENVAASLGRSPARVLWSVTIRLAAPGAAAGAALVFVGVANELTATLLLAPNGTRTLATGFWALSSEIDYAGAAPYAAVLIMLSLPMTWILYRQSQKVSGR